MSTRTPRVFLALLVAATMAPLAFAVPGVRLGLPPVFAFLAVTAGAHGHATACLLLDPDVRRLVAARPLRLGALPAALVAVPTLAFPHLPAAWLAAAMVAFAGCQAWHLGAQNVGVVAFSRLASGLPPTSRFERLTLTAASALGVAGSYQETRPGFTSTLDFGAHVARFDAVGLEVHGASARASVALLALATAHVLTSQRRFTPAAALLYLASVGFFLPTFAGWRTGEGSASCVVSHGLQYMVFAWFALSGNGSRAGRSASVLALVAVVGLGVAAPRIGLGPSAQAAAAGMAAGISSAHFVVDSVIWRLRDAERRVWARRRFDFVFDQTATP